MHMAAQHDALRAQCAALGRNAVPRNYAFAYDTTVVLVPAEESSSQLVSGASALGQVDETLLLGRVREALAELMRGGEAPLLRELVRLGEGMR